MVFDKALGRGRFADGVLALLQEQRIVAKQQIGLAQPFSELRAELFRVQPNHQLPSVVETRLPEVEAAGVVATGFSSSLVASTSATCTLGSLRISCSAALSYIS
ncbi:Uncharacterised protein [Klebsiella grimontii]|uniref:Uncharacterized protein n=1 Tax=Klebsiella grimontii TaxID=2058152 RepID=A0A7H4P7W8_9ENTR|nr:Uncharacterised protein [Klebsiella grimontii]